MSLTSFGALLLPFLLFVVLFRRSWLLPFACVAAVLQGPAFVQIDIGEAAFGITPFVASASFVMLDVLRVGGVGGSLRGLGPQRRALVYLWGAYALVALLSALALPWLFDGAPVHPPLEKEGVHGGLQPLHWTPNHLAQVVNLVLIGGLFARVLQQSARPEVRTQLLTGVIAAIVVALLAGLQQRLAWNGLVPLGAELWASNPSYAQNYLSMSGPVPRVNWPFVEASYASAWFAAMFGGFGAMFLAGVHRHKALAGAIAALFGLGNTLGATGLLATFAYLVLATLVLAWLYLRHRSFAGGLAYRVVLAALAGCCVALSVYLVLRHYGLLQYFADGVGNVLAGRSQTVLGDLRPQADGHSLQLIASSWGLGVGMGSHRGSSFVLTLAACTGFAGLLLFAAGVGLQLRLLVTELSRAPHPASVFFLGAGVAILLGVAIAIPDQNWPVLWTLLLGGFACALHPAHSRHGGSTAA